MNSFWILPIFGLTFLLLGVVVIYAPCFFGHEVVGGSIALSELSWSSCDFRQGGRTTGVETLLIIDSGGFEVLKELAVFWAIIIGVPFTLVSLVLHYVRSKFNKDLTIVSIIFVLAALLLTSFFAFHTIRNTLEIKNYRIISDNSFY